MHKFQLDGQSTNSNLFERHAKNNPVDRMKQLLEEAVDLVPRISDDDPMAPALADWLNEVKVALYSLK